MGCGQQPGIPCALWAEGEPIRKARAPKGVALTMAYVRRQQLASAKMRSARAQ
ncbi:hypothetical protein ACVILH_004930 [Bradyrhizobium sp. USDA 4353]